MQEEQLLKKLAEQINLVLRGEQGYGSGQPWAPHRGHPPLGKSEVERFIDAVDELDDKEAKTSKSKVKISRAFNPGRST